MRKLLFAIILIFALNRAYTQNIFPSSGNAGIGTNSPAVPFQIVKSPSPFTDVPIQQWDPNVAGYNLTLSNFNSAAGIDYRFTQFHAGATFPVLTFSAGNVGIGTTSPTAKLSVSGSGTTSNTGIPSILDVFGNFDGSFGRARLTLGNSANTVGGTRSTSIVMYGMNASGNTYEDKWELGADHSGNGNNDFYFYNAVANTFPLYMSASSNIGIGTITPGQLLTLSSTLNNTTLGLYNTNANSANRNWTINTNDLAYGDFDIRTSSSNGGDPVSAGIARFYIGVSGNIGIGTTTPDAKLAVNGTIHSKEVKVDLTGWPDYVFKPAYNLASLKDVKTYIDQNQHLPDMPSEQQVAKEGLNLGDMNARLLKKVEELTLYLIEKDNEIGQQQEINKQQKATNSALEEKLNKLALQLNKLSKNNKYY